MTLEHAISVNPTMGATDPQISIVFVGGYSRSGSTLFSRMLGQLQGIATVGELSFIWDRGVEKNELCGCGLRFDSCPFWQAVLENAEASTNQFGRHSAAVLHESLCRWRRVPFLLLPRFLRKLLGYEEKMRSYIEVLSALYRNIAKQSGKNIIVDSSRHYAFGLLLSKLPGISLRLIHLVRDSRAVAYSWSVAKEDRGTHGKAVTMNTKRPIRAAFEWMLYNTAFEFLRWQTGASYSLVRYEDFLTSPDSGFTKALSWEAADLPVNVASIEGEGVLLEACHMVAGNPDRFQTGRTELRRDVRWLVDMSWYNKAVVGLVSFPMLLRYGYVGRTKVPEG